MAQIVDLISKHGVSAVVIAMLVYAGWLILRNAPAAIKEVFNALIAALNSISTGIKDLTESLQEMQLANVQAIGALQQDIVALRQLLTNHIKDTARIEGTVGDAVVKITEIKERTRACNMNNQRNGGQE